MINFSEKIQDYLIENFDNEFVKNYLHFIKSEISIYIRIVNPDKIGTIDSLANYGISLEKIDNFENVYKVLSGKEFIGKTLEYNLGHYYIQSLSSMIPAMVLDPKPHEKILDMCAAPGSKSTQIADLMSYKGTFIVNESQVDRVKILAHNLDKMKISNAGILNYRGETLARHLKPTFDKILVDAPCSALGVIQKKGEVSNWWDKKRVNNLRETQLKLLVSAIKLLKKDGELVYSTCTLTLEENELVLDYILNNYPLTVVDIEIPLKSENGITDIKGEKLNQELKKAKRILPWEVDSEGFFLIKLKKYDDVKNNLFVEKVNSATFLEHDDVSLNNMMKNLSDYFGIGTELLYNYKFLKKNDDIYFIEREWNEIPSGDFNRIGLKFGNIDKRSNLLLSSVAVRIMENNINKNIFELESKDELKTYYSGGIIKRKQNRSGQVIVKYNDYFLGTASVIDSGIKSSLPVSLRSNEILI